MTFRGLRPAPLVVNMRRRGSRVGDQGRGKGGGGSHTHPKYNMKTPFLPRYLM